MSGSVLVTCKGYAVDSIYACSVVDISLGGIAIDCPEPMTLNALVLLHSDERSPQRPARVRYCIQRCDLYRVGLEFNTLPQQSN
jgi:hypothetical protein